MQTDRKKHDLLSRKKHKKTQEIPGVFRLLAANIPERAGIHRQLHDTGVLEGLEVPLGDVDVLVAQQTGERIDIQTVTQICLGIVVAGGVRRTTDFFPDRRFGCGLLENMLQCLLGQRIAGAGQEEIVVRDDFVIEVELLDPQEFD